MNRDSRATPPNELLRKAWTCRELGMHVRSKQVAIHVAIIRIISTVAHFQCRLKARIFEHRIMKRLRPVTLTDVGQYRVFQGLDLDLPKGEFVSANHRDGRYQSDHIVTATLEIPQRLAQHHQPSAFGIDGPARCVKVAHTGLHAMVRRKFSGKYLCEPL